jgi:hypothetical protein
VIDMPTVPSGLPPRLTIDPATRATAASDDGQVLLHLETGRICAINAMGARIWSALVEGRSVDEIVTLLGDEYDAPPERIAADVRAFLAQLRDKHYVLARGATE